MGLSPQSCTSFLFTFITVKSKSILFFLLANLITSLLHAQCQLKISLGPDSLKVCDVDTIRLSSNLKLDTLTYFWSTGDSISTIASPTLSGKVVLTVKSPQCQAKDSVFIVRFDRPIINQITSSVTCAGFPTVISHQSIYPPNSTITWNFEKGKDSIANRNSLQYLYPGNGGSFKFYLSIRTSNGCSSKDSAIVKVNPLPKLEILNPRSSFCQGDTAIQIMGNQEGGFFYGRNISESYTAINNFALYSPIKEGKDTIRYEYKDRNGCFNTIKQEVVVYPKPVVNLGKDVNLIPGQQLTLGNEINNQYQYLWSNGSTTSKINIVNPGFYILTATDKISNCFASDTILVDLMLSANSPFVSSTVTVHPNPTTDQVTFSFVSLVSGKATVVLHNLINKLSVQSIDLLEGMMQKISFNLGSYDDGIYFISIENYSWPVLLIK